MSAAPDPHAPEPHAGTASSDRPHFQVHEGGETPGEITVAGLDEGALRRHLPRLRAEAFVSRPETARVLEAAGRDRRAAKAEMVCRKGGFAAAIAHYGEHTPPDVIVLEFDGPQDALLSGLEDLAELCPPETRLLLIGADNDVTLYRRLMQMGVSDYLLRPVEPLVLLDAIIEIAGGGEAEVQGQVIAFMGARGGVGSSTIAHNVAHHLAEAREAVTVLIDTVAGFGTAALQFDLQLERGLADALDEGESLDTEVLDRLVHWQGKRFGLLAAPTAPDAPPPPEGQIAHVIDQARRMARFVVLDLPGHWQPWMAEALQIADKVVLTAAPDLASLRNARTLMALFAQLRPNDALPALVLNALASRPAPPIGAREFARTLDLDPVAVIPADPATLGQAEMAGEVVLARAPRSAPARAIRALAEGLAGGRAGGGSAKPARNGLLAGLLGRG